MSPKSRKVEERVKVDGEAGAGAGEEGEEEEDPESPEEATEVEAQADEDGEKERDEERDDEEDAEEDEEKEELEDEGPGEEEDDESGGTDARATPYPRRGERSSAPAPRGRRRMRGPPPKKGRTRMVAATAIFVVIIAAAVYVAGPGQLTGIDVQASIVIAGGGVNVFTTLKSGVTGGTPSAPVTITISVNDTTTYKSTFSVAGAEQTIIPFKDWVTVNGVYKITASANGHSKTIDLPYADVPEKLSLFAAPETPPGPFSTSHQVRVSLTVVLSYETNASGEAPTSGPDDTLRVEIIRPDVTTQNLPEFPFTNATRFQTSYLVTLGGNQTIRVSFENKRVKNDSPFRQLDTLRSVSANARPQANAGADFTVHLTPPDNGNANFDASASFDPDSTSGKPAWYEWNFGDGSALVNVTTPKISHHYTDQNLYVVSLIAGDALGSFHEDDVRVTVLL